MTSLGVTLHYLVTWRDILSVARENSYFKTATLDEAELFLRDPAAWSAAHGGKAEFGS
jgi:orotate phosphoribosyltransferase